MKVSLRNGRLTLSDIFETFFLVFALFLLFFENDDIRTTFDSTTFFISMFALGATITALLFFIYNELQGFLHESKIRLIKAAIVYSIVVGIFFVISANKLNRGYSDDDVKDVTYQVVDKRAFMTKGKGRRMKYAFYIMRNNEKTEVELSRENWNRFKDSTKITLPEHNGLFGIEYYDEILF